MKIMLILSLLTGENVRDFFFRGVALTFDTLVQREVEVRASDPSKQIGTSLISKY